MKRQLFIATLVTVVAIAFAPLAQAKGGAHGGGGGGGSHHGGSHGFHNFGGGFGAIGGFGGYGGYGCDYGYGYLYDILRDEVPHFAAFPPVYYSEPVPRTYGYSPFAYPPGVMTPEIVAEPQPVTINNPYVPTSTPAAAPADSKTDRAAETEKQVEPLVIMNPYVTQPSAVVQNEQ